MSEAEKRLREADHGTWIDQSMYMCIIEVLAELDRLKNELARSKEEIKRLYTLQVREGGDE